jgi:uncharacterized repeat protein (TIGR03803 family)
MRRLLTNEEFRGVIRCRSGPRRFSWLCLRVFVVQSFFAPGSLFFVFLWSNPFPRVLLFSVYLLFVLHVTTSIVFCPHDYKQLSSSAMTVEAAPLMRPVKIVSLGLVLLAGLANLRAQNFAVLHVFAAFPTGYRTNSDGADPVAGLVLSGTTLYGTAADGGTNGERTVFALDTGSGQFTVLHAFSATSFPSGANPDGASPAGGLTLCGDTLYGTTAYGGTNGHGTVFSMQTDGSQFTVLHTFAQPAQDPSIDNLTNADGTTPQATLLLNGGVLYGTA